jgi:hypothetical protein
MKLKFKWTDELVKEFARDATKGQYGIFKDCPKLSDKIAEFKRIHSTDKELMKSAVRSMSERKFNGLVATLTGCIEACTRLKLAFPRHAQYYDFQIDQYKVKLDMIQDYRK